MISNSPKQKVSLIGGSGFIGTTLAKQLAELGIEFEIIDLRSSPVFPEKTKFGDVRDLASLKDTITGDVVVNLAAVHRDDVKDPSAYYDTNVFGSKNVANACSALNIRKIVFTSSVAVYGFVKKTTGEDGEINPFNDYGRSKYQAEGMFEEWRAQSSENALFIVRPTVVFGEGNRGNVHNLLYQIAKGRFFMVGSGRNHKSMAYVENISRFLLQCICSKRTYGVYNYVDGPDLNMNELTHQIKSKLGKKPSRFKIPYFIGICLGITADFLSKLSGRKFPISLIRVRKFCATTSFSSNKFELDDFQQIVSLREAIDRTVEYEFLSNDKSRPVFFTE